MVIVKSEGLLMKAESGAILQYLVEQYDEGRSFDYTKWPEKAHVMSWLHFQMSGQGPMYGQRAWFARFHPEKIDSALERYGREIKRVLGVIDMHLKRQGTEYLVGDKVTIADLAFVPWNHAIPWLMANEIEWEKEYPACYAWHQRLINREAVQKVLQCKHSDNAS